MSWFANWFDSKYYHILYSNRNDLEAQSFIDNLIQHLEIPKNSKVIDIACGKGRHAKYFNKQGMDVTGIDLSPSSIEFANQSKNNYLQFFVHDMRKTYQKEHFDIVTNLFTSFGYFDDENDEQAAINAMAKNLKGEGLLIIDFMNVKNVIKNLVPKEEKTIDGIQFQIERKVENHHIIKDIYINDEEKSFHFQEKVKVITQADFSNYFKKAGLKIINIFGNYNLDDFDTSSSDRLIMICKKWI